MSDTQEIRKAYRVHGRVQGVGFRYWTQIQGRRLGLRGSVRNCADGTVEVTFAGPRTAVDEMSLQLLHGPSGAHVDELKEVPPPAQLPEDFRIAF
ncbi:MAG: acylphosphatase [Gemmatimonadales bacterium]|jgi:acylphosphatase